MNEITHHATANRGWFQYESEGRKLAEMVYQMAGPHKMIIEHTEVDDSLRGQGIGKKLLEQLVLFVRANHIKVVPLCPFAQATLSKTPEWQDILA